MPSWFEPYYKKWIELPFNLRVKFASLTAISVLMSVGVWFWLQQPVWSVLYQNLGDKELGEIIEVLDQGGLRYKIDGKTIFLDNSVVSATRARLAAQGLPKNEEQEYTLPEASTQWSMNSFQEQEWKRRRMEFEIQKGIDSLDGIRKSRVNLALQKQSVFSVMQKKNSASILVELERDAILTQEQAKTIMFLVSGAVPDLSPDQITLAESTGKLWLNQELNQRGAYSPKQKEQLEQGKVMLASAIRDVLAPVVGLDNIRAQVAMDFDFDWREETKEVYEPNTTGAASVRHQHLKENGAVGSGGAPALASLPTALPPIPPSGILPPPNGSTDNGRKQSEQQMQYELNKTMSRWVNHPGKLKKISVGVVLNENATLFLDPAKKEEYLKSIDSLVKNAVGVDDTRGDVVHISLLPFDEKVQEQVKEEASSIDWLHVLAQVQESKGLASAGLLFGLWLFIWRPLLKTLKAQGGGASSAVTASEAAIENALSPENIGKVLAQNQKIVEAAGQGNQELLKAIEETKNLAQSNPQVLANMIKQWMNQDSEGKA